MISRRDYKDKNNGLVKARNQRLLITFTWLNRESIQLRPLIRIKYMYNLICLQAIK